jgi:predicted nucleic acid-binding protein
VKVRPREAADQASARAFLARRNSRPARWADTFDAEYAALTQLHADALVTLDRQLAHAVKDLVTVEPIEALY